MDAKTTPQGVIIASEFTAMANKQAEIMMRIASEFGFTPASRSRISVPSDQEPTLFDFAANTEEVDGL